MLDLKRDAALSPLLSVGQRARHVVRAAIQLSQGYAIETVVAVGKKGDPAVLPDGVFRA